MARLSQMIDRKRKFKVRERNRCPQCGNIFSVEDYLIQCPNCGEAKTLPFSGDELQIAYIDMEEP